MTILESLYIKKSKIIQRVITVLQMVSKAHVTSVF